MARVRLSTDLAHDQRVMCAGNEAFGLLVRAMMRALDYHQGENVVDDAGLRLMAGSTSAYRRLTTKLVGWSLLVGHPNGRDWCFADDLWQAAHVRSRGKVDPAVRQQVYAAANYRCEECFTPNDLTLDHIHPWSLGGSDDADNLRCLCRPCNSRKGARV